MRVGSVADEVRNDAEPPGFAEFKKALEEETAAFGESVVLVHGDIHTFRIDKPGISEQYLLNFTRIETFGSPEVHWARASVDTRDPEVFTSHPEIVEENPATPQQSTPNYVPHWRTTRKASFS